MESINRYLIGCMLLACILVSADAQQTTTTLPANTGSGGIGVVYDAIEKNTKAVNENTKKLDSTLEAIEQLHNKWIARYIFGTGMFMLFIYGGIGLVNSYYRRRGLKKTQQHMAEQDKKIQDQDKNLLLKQQTYLKNHEDIKKILDEYVRNTQEINEMIKTGKLTQEEMRKIKLRTFVDGVGIGILGFILLELVMGVL